MPFPMVRYRQMRMPGVKLGGMQFRHRTVYHLLGIQAIDADPWTLLDSVPIGSIDDKYGRWLQQLGLDGPTLRAEITFDEQVFHELDLRTAIANSMLDGSLGIVKTVDKQREEIRLERSGRFGNTAWLVPDIDGDDPRSTDPERAVDDELGASIEVTNTMSMLNELSSSRAAELHHFVAGAVMLAAGRPTYISTASKGCWHVRTDAAPHFGSHLGGRPPVLRACPSDRRRRLGWQRCSTWPRRTRELREH